MAKKARTAAAVAAKKSGVKVGARAKIAKSTKTKGGEKEKTQCQACESENKPFGLRFEVKDANGMLCTGMYYTIKLKNLQETITGTTDAKGLTQPCYSGISDDEVFLYIGHRNSTDNFPEARSGHEEIYDEAPLTFGTVAPILPDISIHSAQTQRLWKPWTASSDAKDFTRSEEGTILNPYDNDGAALGNVTIGTGKKIHDGPFVMNQIRVDQIQQYLNDNGQPITVANIVAAVGPATGLVGQDLSNAQAEMRVANGITALEAQNDYESKTYPLHISRISSSVFVPLYQNEYDALADIAYNRGPGSIDKANKKYNIGGSYAAWLNRGRYYYTGDDRVRNLARTAVPKRRDKDADLFLNGIYPKGSLTPKLNNGKNQPPWDPISLTP